jgi:glycosyltransferase involved in cell wall biosynthesis
VWEDATGAGFGAVNGAKKIELEEGFRPDIIVGHVGWGELTFFKQLWADVPIIGFFEYYYRATGGPVGFDTEEPVNAHAPFLLQARNAVPNSNIMSVDRGLSPTHWQRDCFPPEFHNKIYVCHDGIRTDKLLPDPDAKLKLGRIDTAVRHGDEIITYMARNLERMRGFHKFMRALPDILEARPHARVVVIGGNEVSYGAKNKSPGGLRGEMEAVVGDRVDWSRVHFLGQVPYADYQKIIQVSRCHIYLTMPFVLSWSLLEAMSMQATIVAANVAPVREAVTHNETGLLIDFHDHTALARQVIEVCARPQDYAHLGPAARRHVVREYDFLTKCLPEHIAEMNALLPADKQIRMPD